MDEFVSPRPKMDVSHEVNCKMNANAKCILPNELNSRPFTMPKPNFFGGHKFSIPYRNQSRAVKRFGCFHSTPIFLNALFLLKRCALNRAKC